MGKKAGVLCILMCSVLVVFFFFTLDLNLALQKLLVENRADLPLLFWWAFYGTINA